MWGLNKEPNIQDALKASEEQNVAHRKLIKKLQLEIKELKKIKNHGVIGDVMILPSPNDKKRERIAYLRGVLEYNIWADAVPNGNEKCDAYEKELSELTGES